MTPREIADLFAQMELRLVRSLKRNLSAHKAEERRRGIQWPAWQAEKLRGIRKYREDNRSIVSGYADVIDRETEQMLEEEYAAGSAQVDRDAAAAGVDAPEESPRFFGVNRQKIDGLIEEINGGLHDAESASLRTMDDVYRRTLYRAELELAGGSVTVPQAVDMAVKDFLAAGINCIEYSNGRRVNIASYAEMALRTASTRATLRGEAERRKAYNIDTVLVSQYGACSDTCLPWQGRVYIDDVWGDFDGDVSGDMGRSVNGKWYPLLSMAVAAGLFHPNCRHTVSTWFDGVSRMPPPMDADRVREISRLEQEQRRLERKVRRYKRLAEGSQDPKQAKEYRRKVRGAQAELRGFIGDHSDVLRRDPWREKTYDTAKKPADAPEMQLSDSKIASAAVGPQDMGAALDKFRADAQKMEEPYRDIYGYYAESTDFVRDDGLKVPIGYDPKTDTVRYNPASMDGIELPDALPHELAHRYDALAVQSWDNDAWTAALTDAADRITMDIGMWQETADAAENPFVSDILSALSRGGLYTLYGHDADYWTARTIPAEAFADMLAAAGTGRGKAEIERLFPGIMKVFQNMIGGV